MANYAGTVSAPHSPEEVWRYLADLRSIAQWDPSVAAARLVDRGSPTRRSKPSGRTASSSRHSRITLRGRRHFPRPHRNFSAETDLVSIRDEARIGPSLDGSTVTWDADLQLKGAWRVLDLPLRAAFRRLGESAERGLRERLNEPTLRGSVERVEA